MMKKWSKYLVEINAGDKVSSNVTAGNGRVENEEEKDLQSFLHKLHHTQAAQHCKSELFLQIENLILAQLDWFVDSINFGRKVDCCQM